MRRLWLGLRAGFRQSPVLTTFFLLVSAVALFFLVNVAVGLFDWDPPENEPIRPWMTVGYIGRSWGLDPRSIDAEAGLPLPAGRPQTLQEIADDRGVPVADIVALVERTVADMIARGIGLDADGRGGIDAPPSPDPDRPVPQPGDPPPLPGPAEVAPAAPPPALPAAPAPVP